MSQPLRNEFQLSSFCLNYPIPEAFTRCQWSCSRWVYLVWRGLWLLWNVAVTVASAAVFREHLASSSNGGVKWFIYYSHITFIVTALASLVDFIGAVKDPSYEHDNEHKDRLEKREIEKEEIIFHGEFIVLEGLKEKSSPFLQQATWLLYAVINSSNILASAWFWAVTYDSHTYAIEVVAHVTNTIYVISNLLVSGQPVRLLHAVYPVAYTSMYILFTVAYHEAGGTTESGQTRIYKELDWNDAYPTAVVVVVGLLVVLPMMHCIVFAFYTFRVYLHSRLNSETYCVGDRLTGAEAADVQYVVHSSSGCGGGIRNLAFEDDGIVAGSKTDIADNLKRGSET